MTSTPEDFLSKEYWVEVDVGGQEIGDFTGALIDCPDEAALNFTAHALRVTYRDPTTKAQVLGVGERIPQTDPGSFNIKYRASLESGSSSSNIVNANPSRHDHLYLSSGLIRINPVIIIDSSASDSAINRHAEFNQTFVDGTTQPFGQLTLARRDRIFTATMKILPAFEPKT